ncbi:MAG TPA: hypothetical protein VKY74_18215 [Chloroflexia bacterium]|nr:hypothetical protein [Chloroflexia bacterium]
MTLSPTVLVFLGLGTAYALLFHLWRGRNIQQLILFWLVSILGFGVGSFLAGLLPLHGVLLGGVPIVEASLGAVLLLGVTARLIT